jgi:hypothetical protein
MAIASVKIPGSSGYSQDVINWTMTVVKGGSSWPWFPSPWPSNVDYAGDGSSVQSTLFPGDSTHAPGSNLVFGVYLNIIDGGQPPIVDLSGNTVDVSQLPHSATWSIKMYKAG